MKGRKVSRVVGGWSTKEELVKSSRKYQLFTVFLKTESKNTQE